MPIAEAQSEWVCDHLTGSYLLPPRAEMLADIARERTAMRRRYVASKRHTMQVDFDDYMFDLRRERRRGRRRAGRMSGRTAPAAH
jgi:dimethylaniline monooxygenase (N-oxide forming)